MGVGLAVGAGVGVGLGVGLGVGAGVGVGVGAGVGVGVGVGAGPPLTVSVTAMGGKLPDPHVVESLGPDLSAAFAVQLIGPLPDAVPVMRKTASSIGGVLPTSGKSSEGP